MKRAPLRAGLCALLAALAAAPAFGSQCSLQMLSPLDGKVSAGATTITLGEADQKSQATAWQGPVQAGACTFDVGIIEQPLALTPDQKLYVTTYSGSVRNVTLFDLNTCKVSWKSPNFSGDVALTPQALKMGGSKRALDRHCMPAAVRKKHK